MDGLMIFINWINQIIPFKALLIEFKPKLKLVQPTHGFDRDELEWILLQTDLITAENFLLLNTVLDVSHVSPTIYRAWLLYINWWLRVYGLFPHYAQYRAL